MYDFDEIEDLKDSFSFELECVWGAVSSYIASSFSTSNNKILQRGGGYEDQDYLFWAMVEFIEDTVAQLNEYRARNLNHG